jgi:hypothetical protein
MSMRTILGVLVIAAVLAGCGGAAGTQVPSASVAPSSSGAFGGTVTFQSDGNPATTKIDAVADGASLSGTAVTTFGTGTHTVQVECAADDDGGWVLGGTVEATTLSGESPGTWSAVIVRDGSPQQIGIWLSAGPEAGDTCDAFLSSFDPAELDPENFSPIESGELLPPA